ncbi:MAG: CIA30 family protein [Pseudomonadota bacterium]
MLTHLVLTLTLMSAAPPELENYLVRTIERGAPLFNAGNPQACAAVYETALDSVASQPGWGLPEDERERLADRLEFNKGITDPAERAWAYRSLIDQILAGEAIEALALAESLLLFDFTADEQIDPWRVVLDGVMGGLSTGDVVREGDRMIFTGETSLRNNGGFSSIRARIPVGSLAGYNALQIEVIGDGRTYILGTSSRTGRGDSYWTRFETTAGETTSVTVPITEMVRHFFGNPIRGRLQPAQVAGLEFYIYDSEEGPFRMEIDRIEAVR